METEVKYSKNFKEQALLCMILTFISFSAVDFKQVLRKMDSTVIDNCFEVASKFLPVFTWRRTEI